MLEPNPTEYELEDVVIYDNKSSISSSNSPMTVSFSNVRYSVQPQGVFLHRFLKTAPEPLQILHGVSGVIRPGEMLAIIGGSGAGKSTLLDILAGRKSTGQIDGHVKLNGVDIAESGVDTARRLSTGYVTQEDVFKPTLTVREHLQFHAELTLDPLRYSAEQRRSKVQLVMQDLGIEHRADTRIGDITAGKKGLSGGERKRLAVAEQLLREPSVLFLDEPTSGLDSFNALALLQLLHKLCARGMTIVMTIHQPRSSIYELFDKLMILHQGRAVFFGPANQATTYFGALGHVMPPAQCPSDFILDVVLGTDREGTFAAKYQTSIPYSALTASINEVEAHVDRSFVENAQRPVSFSKATRELLHRQWLDTLRNPLAALLFLCMMAVFGLIAGSVFYKLDFSPAGQSSRVAVLIFILMSGAFPITTLSIVVIYERGVINRERAAGLYSNASYNIVRLILDFPLLIILPVIYNGILYYMVGLRPEATAFFTLLGITILNSICAGSLYVLVGSLAPEAVVGSIACFLFTVALMFYAGFFVPGPALVAFWRYTFYWVSFFRWGFQSLMINEFAGTLGGDALVAQYGFAGWDIWQGAVALLVQIAVFRGLLILSFGLVNQEKR